MLSGGPWSWAKGDFVSFFLDFFSVWGMEVACQLAAFLASDSELGAACALTPDCWPEGAVPGNCPGVATVGAGELTVGGSWNRGPALGGLGAGAETWTGAGAGTGSDGATGFGVTAGFFFSTKGEGRV